MNIKKIRTLSSYYYDRPAPAIIGQVAGDNFSALDWTEQGALTTWTYNAGSIDSVGTGGGFASLIRYNKWFSMTEAAVMTSIFTINTVSATNVLFGTGLTGVSIFSSNPSFWISVWSNIANQGLCELYYGNGNLVGSGNVTFSAGDQIKTTLSFSNNGLTVTATIQNYTTQGATTTITYTNTNAFVFGSGAPATPLIFQPAFNNYKGNYTINSWTYSINEYNNIDLLLIGDSKTEGNYGGSYPNTIPGLWKSNNALKKIQLEAASGNVTQDILNCMPEILLMKPKKAMLFVGRNDVANSVPDGTWQANHASIISQLQSIGCVIYPQVHLTETLGGSGFDTLKNYVTALNNSIPEPPTWDKDTDNQVGDGVHPNTAGSLKVYNNQSSIIIL